MNIALASDHRGYHLKMMLREYLANSFPGIVSHVTDFGCSNADSCDYPDFIAPASYAISTKEMDRGIFICGTGIGTCIVANKFRGIRAALCHDEVTATASRRHNDANVLCLGADLLSEVEVQKMVSSWLMTAFEGDRHQRRIDKIDGFEENGYPVQKQAV